MAAEAPAAAALPEPDGRPLDPPQATETETAAAPPPPARETTPALAASAEPAGETSDTAAASDEAASGDTPGADLPPARATRQSRRGGRKRGKRADSPPAEGTDLPAEEPVVPAAAQEFTS